MEYVRYVIKVGEKRYLKDQTYATKDVTRAKIFKKREAKTEYEELKDGFKMYDEETGMAVGFITGIKKIKIRLEFIEQ